MINTTKALGRLTVAELNAGNLAHNISALHRLIGQKTKLMLMVKANAYGHGAVEIARLAEKLPVGYLGVVCLSEAGQLRNAGIHSPIAIMNYIDPDGAREALDLGCEMVVLDEAVLASLDNHARRTGKRACIHVKIDTGMHRSGLMPEDALRFIPTIETYKNIELEGMCTHLADADNPDLSFTHHQLAVFERLIDHLGLKGIHPPHIHVANSAAVVRLPNVRKNPYTMIRPGIIAYGLSPTGAAPGGEFSFPFVAKPVLSLKTRIVHVTTIEPGETVGYGRTFRAQRTTRIGLLPIGYGDGFRRAPQSWKYVLVRGKQAPVIGRISMDQTTIDVTDIPDAGKNDEVILIGTQGSRSISAEEVASWMGTINYEIVTALTGRVERRVV